MTLDEKAELILKCLGRPDVEGFLSSVFELDAMVSTLVESESLLAKVVVKSQSASDAVWVLNIASASYSEKMVREAINMAVEKYGEVEIERARSVVEVLRS